MIGIKSSICIPNFISLESIIKKEVPKGRWAPRRPYDNSETVGPREKSHESKSYFLVEIHKCTNFQGSRMHLKIHGLVSAHVPKLRDIKNANLVIFYPIEKMMCLLDSGGNITYMNH